LASRGEKRKQKSGFDKKGKFKEVAPTGKPSETDKGIKTETAASTKINEEADATTQATEASTSATATKASASDKRETLSSETSTTTAST